MIQRTIGIGFWLVVLAGIIIGALYFTGHFDEKIETPDVPDIPIIPDEIPTIPTEPNCVDKLYVTIYRYDLRTGEYDWFMFEGNMKCHNIDAYSESPDFVVEYDNGYREAEIKIQTSWDADTNGWQEGYNA